MWPDYHGNRSPLADPSLKGAVVGLSLDTDTASLATMYLATLQVGVTITAVLYCDLLQALCYGTRHIVDTMVEAGHRVDSVTVCGGLARSTLFLQTQVAALQLYHCMSHQTVCNVCPG